MPAETLSKTLLIVWHSRTDASHIMAKAAADAACEEINVDMCEASQVTIEQVLCASAYLFAFPENLASMSGVMKEFFDRSYYPALGKIEGRSYGSIIAAGSDGSGAQQQLDRIVTGWRLRRVVDPLIVNFEAQSPEQILAPKKVCDAASQKCRDIGQTLAAGLSMGVF